MKKNKQFKQLDSAYGRLQEALAVPLTEPLALDGTIQRFEFTFELAWKTLKTFLADQGIICNSPKSCLQEAFTMGWLSDEENWLALFQARNLTSHVYNEEMAMDIYATIKEHHALFSALIIELRKM